MKKWVKIALAITAVTIYDGIVYIETDPKWVLYMTKFVWYGYGAFISYVFEKSNDSL